MPEQIPLMVDAATQELRQFASDETIPKGQLLAALQAVVRDSTVILPEGMAAELLEAIQGKASDAPLCMTCGVKMRPAGSCYVCEGCGSTSGCS